MTGVDYIALSIPVFFALIGLELLVARLQHKDLYRLNDSLNNLACGTLQQVLGVFTKVVVFGAYVWLWQRAALLVLDGASVWVWVICFLAVDHQYYWFHRISHESNLPWGAHIVHHSSEEYNLAVALRQGAFQPLFSWVFYLPLAWIGFPPLVFLACSSFNTLYQFWIHTRTIGKLGPIEWVFNTPSHHRVHHGCDLKYLDKNYAGTLIVWDRLFGSFKEEEEEPTYGVTKPLQSWNPLWANLHYYADLAAMSRQAPNLREKIKVWLKPPAWRPDWKPDGPGDDRATSPLTHGEAGKYDAKAPRGLVSYAVIHFASALGGSVALLFLRDSLPQWGVVALAVGIAWTLTTVGVLFDGRRWVLPVELLRLVAVALAVIGGTVGRDGATALAGGLGAVVLFGVFAAWLLRYRSAFVGAPASAAGAG